MMACDDYYCLGTQLPSLSWNLDDLGALAGAECGTGLGILNEHVSLVVQPPEMAEVSTGYLEDAVVQWSDRCKRRRALLFPHERPAALEDVTMEDLVQGFWNSNCHFDTFAASLTSLTENHIATLSDNPSLSSIPMKEAAKTEEPKASKLVREQELVSSSSTSSSSSSCKDVSTSKGNVHGKGSTASRPTVPPTTDASPAARYFPIKEREETQPRKKVTTRVVYPFAVVRPGGVDGGVTLKDINRRLLMRPTRPVRHPVGEFACLPCVSGDGHGLSGKAVVGITRIQTRGRGTITIIRTKG